MSSSSSSKEPAAAQSASNWDPVYLHSLRETGFILVLFVICLVWSLTVCYFDGYRSPGEPIGEVPLVLGMPRWVFWGLVVPWIFADLVTVVFCFWWMVDDDLGTAHEGEDLAEQLAHASEGESRDV